MWCSYGDVLKWECVVIVEYRGVMDCLNEWCDVSIVWSVKPVLNGILLNIYELILVVL